MNYTQQADLLKEMTADELAELAGVDGVIDPDRIEKAAGDARALIDSYIADRYILVDEQPFDPFIKKLSDDLTIANLYEHIMGKSALPNTIVWRRLNAMKFLLMLRKGQLSLPDSIENDKKAKPKVKSPAERDFSSDQLKLMYK